MRGDFPQSLCLGSGAVPREQSQQAAEEQHQRQGEQGTSPAISRKGIASTDTLVNEYGAVLQRLAIHGLAVAGDL
jgi:hypothetical protein